MAKRCIQAVGVLGTLVCLIIFVREPSWPTPDKLLLFIVFVFMIFSQGWQVFKRLAPFVGLLLVYESFRGVASHLNNHVNYSLMPAIDRWLFVGHLPTATLQSWLWRAHVQWYDFVFYLVYMLHFVLPLALALLIWKLRDQYYWRYITAYVSVSFAGFLTFLFFPAAPPWLASEKGLIEPIIRISSQVFYALGIADFPSIYSKISPNPIAAVPSLHAAYSLLLALFVTKLFGKKWGLLAAVYPLFIAVGTVYQGEHYVFDLLVGWLYAIAAYYAAPYILRGVKQVYIAVKR